MANYIIEDGVKKLQLDDGSTAPVVAIVPLSDGLGVALTPAQLAALTPPANPTEFPLPPGQLNTLKPPANPTEFPLPSGQLATLTPPQNPADYPLPATQSGWLQALRDRVLAFVRGSGDYDSNTLRVVVAANQPEMAIGTPGAKSTPIIITGAGEATIVTPSANKRLRISYLQLQCAATTKVRWISGAVALTAFLEFDRLEMALPEAIVLGVNEPFKIEVSVETPNPVGGFIVWREVA